MNEDIIKSAIELQKPIVFEYNKPSKVRGKRIGNPHALFYESTNNLVVDLFQTDGVSDSGLETPEWREFLVEFMENIEILDYPQFSIAEGYNPTSSKYNRCIAKV